MTPLGSRMALRMALIMTVAFARVAPGNQAQFALNERAFSCAEKYSGKSIEGITTGDERTASCS